MRTGMKKNPKLMKQTSKFGYPNDKGSSQAQRWLRTVALTQDGHILYTEINKN